MESKRSEIRHGARLLTGNRCWVLGLAGAGKFDPAGGSSRVSSGPTPPSAKVTTSHDQTSSLTSLSLLIKKHNVAKGQGEGEAHRFAHGGRYRRRYRGVHHLSARVAQDPAPVRRSFGQGQSAIEGLSDKEKTCLVQDQDISPSVSPRCSITFRRVAFSLHCSETHSLWHSQGHYPAARYRRPVCRCRCRRDWKRGQGWRALHDLRPL